MGLFRVPSLGRASLVGTDDGESRQIVGALQIEGDRVLFQPGTSASSRPPRDPGLFVRGDGGWASGMHPLDRFVKNTHEILGPLNDLTARLPMNHFAFLTPDQSVRRTVFGEGEHSVATLVNLGVEAFPTSTVDGSLVTLPPGGFLVESPTFLALCTTQWGDVAYPSPALFTLRSLDDRPLLESERIHVFHGFGEDRLPWKGRVETVERQTVWVGR